MVKDTALGFPFQALGTRSILEGNQGRNLEAEAGSDAYLACIVTEPRITCLEVAPSTTGWALPIHHYLSKELSKQVGLLMGQSGRDMFSVEVPSFQVTLAWVKSTQN